MKNDKWFPIPTRFAVLLVGAGIGVAFVLGWRAALFYDLVILSACLFDSLAAPGKQDLVARRMFPAFCSQGVAQEFELVISNKGARPRRLRVRDQTPVGWPPAPILNSIVPARSSLHLRYSATPPERGVFTFSDIHLRVEGPLGLAARSSISPAVQELKVFPRLAPMHYPDLASYRRTSIHIGTRRSKWHGEGREFDSLREYVEGDDPRKIHWKATARLDRPVVQEFQPERNQVVMIVVDSGRLMCAMTEGRTKMDYVMDSAVQLAHAALKGGDQPGILAFAERVLCFVPPRRTPGQLQRLLEETLSLRPRLVEPQYEQAFLQIRARIQKRCLVVIYTDWLDEVASENLLDALALLRPRHLPVCVAVRETEWDRLLARRISSLDNVYERSALVECLRQRKKGLMRLVQKGAIAMDLPASNLARGITEKYLEVKRKGLL
ncbi:MAG: hypothetical protein CVU57_25655 [Deltaproteobacteria bacterium HGW-Deltaproteobacteria-15]|jgi:uncharacterized protein (DUF58 family)|nr:MAG: hypothetical protein CVU57_25655 [Deltaproteobacteria bacterium HGW-Deltaproteobacteria-15]